MTITNKQALSALTAWIVEAMEYLPLSEEVKAGPDILLDLQKSPEQATLTAPKLDPSTTCIECFRPLCQCGECHHCLSFEASNLGRVVRNAWINRYQERENPNPSHLVPYAKLDQWDKETDNVIGEEVARYMGVSVTRNCHLCQTLTTSSCAACHKPACENCGTVEMVDMDSQEEDLMCNKCWQGYGQALNKKPALDISLYTFSFPPRNYAEAERYEHVSQLVYHAIEELEEQNIPLSIAAIHESLGQPALIEEVREIVREQYAMMDDEPVRTDDAAFLEFCESVEGNEEYAAYVDHLYTPKAEDY